MTRWRAQAEINIDAKLVRNQVRHACGTRAHRRPSIPDSVRKPPSYSVLTAIQIRVYIRPEVRRLCKFYTGSSRIAVKTLQTCSRRRGHGTARHAGHANSTLRLSLFLYSLPAAPHSSTGVPPCPHAHNDIVIHTTHWIANARRQSLQD